jgi:hypothetical protein
MEIDNQKLVLESRFEEGKIQLTCGEDRMKLGSRIFIDGKWYDVVLEDESTVRPLSGLEIQWHVRKVGRWFTLRAVLTNAGSTPLCLGAFHMLEGEGFGGTLPEDVVLVDSGGGWFAGAVRVNSTCPHYLEKWNTYFLAEEDIAWAKQIQGELEAGAHYSLSGMIAHYRKTSKPTWIFSFTTPMQRCTGVPFVLIDPANGKIRRLALSNNFAGYELAPGESIETEEVMIGASSSSFKGLEDWAQTCAERRNVKVTKQPPMGWLSWYGYYLTQNEKETLRVAELINKEFSGKGFRYIQLDLGYNKGNLPGDWFETNESFPHGLKWLKERLDEKGFTMGVWIAPFFVAANSDFAKEHPEALLKTHPSDPGKWFWKPHADLLEIDITHPEGERFFRKIFSHFKAIGINYFKLDFLCRAGRVDVHFVTHDKKIIKGIEFYRRMQQIILDELDDDDYVYWCSNLLHFGIGLGDTSMSCCDIGNTGFESNTASDGPHENVEHFKRQATSVISRYYLHQNLLLLNSDSVNVAPPADIEECRLRATFVAMSGGQVFLGDRFDLATEDRLGLVRQITPPYGRSARPVDLFQRVYPEGYPAIWHLHVDSWDKREMVTLLNLGDNNCLSVTLEQLGLEPGQKHHLWEFWQQRYLGVTDSEIRVELPNKSCRLVAVVPQRSYPWVLGTSFHYTQGGVDLRDVSWDGVELSGELCETFGQGNIILHVPPQYRCDLECIAPEIYRYRPQMDSKKKWRISFKSDLASESVG